VNYRIPKILLGNFVSFSEVGIFNVSMIGFAAALALPNAIRQSSQPMFARLGADGDGISRRGVFFRSRRIARFGTIFGLPAGLIAGFYGFPVIFPNLELADGNRLFEILSILMVGWNSILLTSPDWGRVMGHERPFGYAAAIGLSVITQLIGCTFFGSEFGAEEAAISFATGAILSSLVFLYCTGTTEGRVAMFQGVLEYGLGMSFAVIAIVGDFSGPLQKTMLCLLIGILWHVSVEKLGRTPPQTKGE
jgi:O-antigen/teichoic acid export membrane protein